MNDLGASYPPAPPVMPTMYDTFEHMDTGLKTFLGGAVLGLLLLIKTLYQMCSAMFYPPPGSSYTQEDNAAPQPPALPKSGSTPAAVLIPVLDPKKLSKPQRPGMAFGGGAKIRSSPGKGKGNAKQSPSKSEEEDATASLLDGTSDLGDEEPARRSKNGARRDSSSKARRIPSRVEECSESSGAETDSPERPLARGSDSVLSSRASHASSRMDDSAVAAKDQRNGKGSCCTTLCEKDSPAKRPARLPAHLTCD